MRGKVGGDTTAPDIARVLEERADRDVSRGALYAALDRLEDLQVAKVNGVWKIVNILWGPNPG